MPRFPSGYKFHWSGWVCSRNFLENMRMPSSLRAASCPSSLRSKGFESRCSKKSHGSDSAEVIVGGPTGSRPSEQFLRASMHQCFRSAPTTSICIERCSSKEKELRRSRRSGHEGIQKAADVVHFRTNLRSQGWNTGLRIGRMSVTFRQRH